MRELHIDYETYCELDLQKVGLYRYCEHPSFELLLVAWAYDDEPTQQVSIVEGEQLPACVRRDLKNPAVKKLAHNAPFEREVSRRALGIVTDPAEWEDSMIKAYYMGLPGALKDAARVLRLDIQKLASGTRLINLFCRPAARTGARTWFWERPEEWAEFKRYSRVDVDSERALCRALESFPWPVRERELYLLDRRVNEGGIEVDLDFARKAWAFDCEYKKRLAREVSRRTGIQNPNSTPQLLEWLEQNSPVRLTDLKKETVEAALKRPLPPLVRYVLESRQQLSKTSNNKYLSMQMACSGDGRLRNTLQFGGANRTGRWAARLVQLHNLPQNHLEDWEMACARELVRAGDYDLFSAIFPNVPDTLKQLIRTAFRASPGRTLLVADYAAIEARVAAWLADCGWRKEVFRTHGKIYEASASQAFGVPLDQCGKGTHYRVLGKFMELAFGFGGGVVGFRRFAGELGERMSDAEIAELVRLWREASPEIVQYWAELNRCAMSAVRYPGQTFEAGRGVAYRTWREWLVCRLPSGRCLMYHQPEIRPNKFGNPGLTYLNKGDRGVYRDDTYGGKLFENAVQAIARDCLGEAMLRFRPHWQRLPIVLHVHDEIVADVRKTETNDADLEFMCTLMAQPLPWAPGLRLRAEGFISDYYKKD